jgi:hypothetical protein
MNYGEVLTRAWKIIWKFKVLWIFGILASCGTGNGGNNFNYRFSGSDLPPQFQQAVGNSQQFFNNYGWVIGLLICLICVLIIVAIFLSTLGKIALIKGTLNAEAGAEHIGFLELFNGSLPYFWRVLGLSLLFFILSFVLITTGILLAVTGTILTFGIALFCLIPLCCLMIPVFWAAWVIVEQAYIAIVVENRGAIEGLVRGWEVVKTRWEPMLVMGIILIFGAAIAGFIISIPLFIVLFPLFFVMGITAGSNMTPLAIGGICFLIYLPVLILASGIIHAYVHSAWTLTFLRVTGHGATPEANPGEPAASLPPLEPVNA